MKMFLFSVAKKLAWYWAAKLLSPEAVSELLITLADAHAQRTDTTTDDQIVVWLKEHLEKEVKPEHG